MFLSLINHQHDNQLDSFPDPWVRDMLWDTKKSHKSEVVFMFRVHHKQSAVLLYL